MGCGWRVGRFVEAADFRINKAHTCVLIGISCLRRHANKGTRKEGDSLETLLGSCSVVSACSHMDMRWESELC